MRTMILNLILAMACAGTSTAEALGPNDLTQRPYQLIDALPDGALKSKLQSCKGQPLKRSDFSIAHRGAPLMYPEHSVQSNKAAAQMGAGVFECDVTFTEDLELVCRHSQNDLASTTNILSTDLAATCITPFQAAKGNRAAQAECRTSDITLDDFRRLSPRMEGFDKQAKTTAAFHDASNGRTTQFVTGATLMTHADSIALFKNFGGKFTPELKAPVVDMPFNGLTQQAYAQKLVDAYKAADIPAADVFLQSFNLEDVLYWIKAEPAFGAQAVYLDGRYSSPGFDPNAPSTLTPTMQALHDQGVRFIAPPLWVLVTTENGKIVPSAYARAAQEAGLNILTWTLERSGSLANGGGWYYQSIRALTKDDSMTYTLLHVLAQDVGVKGVFSDWPATVTFYANCYGL